MNNRRCLNEVLVLGSCREGDAATAQVPVVRNNDTTGNTTGSSRLLDGEQERQDEQLLLVGPPQVNNNNESLASDAAAVAVANEGVAVSANKEESIQLPVAEISTGIHDRHQEIAPLIEMPREEALEEGAVLRASTWVVVSDNERSNNFEPQKTVATTTATVQHSEHRDVGQPAQSLSNQTVEEITNRTNSGASAENTALLQPPYNNHHDHHYHHNEQGNTALSDGGEMFFHYPPSYETVGTQPQWMVTPQQQLIHPYHHQQQQQIDHAVAYANAAAHVAWAAAEAVKQAVLHQQQQPTTTITTFTPQYYPPPQTPLLMGGPSPLLAPPPNGWTPPPPQLSPPPMGWTQSPSPWIGHNFLPHPPPPYFMTPPQALMTQNYNANVTPSHFGSSDSAQSVSNYLQSQVAPYLDENDKAERQPCDDHFEEESATFIPATAINEPSTYHSEEDTVNHGHDYGRRGWYPRKRQQRRSVNDSHPKQQQFLAQPPPVRDNIRRRVRSSDNESSSSGGYYHHSKQNWNDGINKAPNQDKPSRQNGVGRGHNSNSMNKKARSTNNEALIGKTGVAALFEWCNKRQCTPTFTIQKIVQSLPATVLDDEFECIVYLEQHLPTASKLDESSTDVRERQTLDDSNCEDGFLHEWGRGHGRSKNAAKQDSARRAMQALFPGIQFDEETGILFALPRVEASSDGRSSNPSNCLDDLAPNLAKQLDINCDDTPGRKSIGIINATTYKKELATHNKRTLGTYPETSTTSEDEDRSTYYASRGASICSVLLHSIIQLDKKRLPDMPSFTYEVSPSVSTSNSFQTDTSRICSNESTLTTKQTVARCLRGSFKCTAKLKIVSGCSRQVESQQVIDEGTGESISKNAETCEESTLEAVGMGGTKRDSRHVATAKLLSLLFPECKNDMVKVKTAAELMRDNYAAIKNHKHHHHIFTRNRRLNKGGKLDSDVETQIEQTDDVSSPGANFSFALSKVDDPPLPHFMSDLFAILYSIPATTEEEPIVTGTCETDEDDLSSHAVAANICRDGDLPPSQVFRQLGRQKQMDYLIDSALHRFNELDDEGRVVCGGGSEDDVGRTILRRAEPSDIPRIKKLMCNKKQEKYYKSNGRDNYLKRHSVDLQKGGSKHQVSELSSTLADVTITCEDSRQASRIHEKKSNAILLSQLWSSTSSTVLLLCRAIAAFEDPPLGCVYLSFEFSMEKGKVLRVMEIGSESHLPQERFLDCLQSFANCINFVFERSHSNDDDIQHGRLGCTTKDLMAIVASYAKRPRDDENANVVEGLDVDNSDTGPNGKRFQSLRPVQEESEGSDDDDSKSSSSQTTNPSQLANKPPGSVKPSKRSRFQ